LDHTGDVVRDSVSLTMDGFGLPSLEIAAFGGTLDLGEGRNAFSVKREGGQIEARMRWVSDQLAWSGASGGAGAGIGDVSAASIGSPEWARDLVGRTLAGLERVELDMGLVGSLESPGLEVSSNLGDAVAESLRREVGREIEAAEARVRGEVDGLVQPLVQDARGRVEALTAGVGMRVADQRAEVEALRVRLEERLGELVGDVR